MIKNFRDFNESYLDGGRQPLYHFSHHIFSIISSDVLKTHRPSRQSHGSSKSISVTRSILYSSTASSSHLELDYDELMKFGYRSYPVDEWAWDNGRPNRKAMDKFHLGKSNFDNFKNGLRGTKNNIDELPNHFTLELEFEERIYKNIENIGKYIKSINIEDFRISKQERLSEIGEYLKKYPHIKVNKMINKDVNKKVDITDYCIDLYEKSKNTDVIKQT